MEILDYRDVDDMHRDYFVFGGALLGSPAELRIALEDHAFRDVRRVVYRGIDEWGNEVYRVEFKFPEDLGRHDPWDDHGEPEYAAWYGE